MNKKTVRLLLIVVAVCLLISGLYVVFNRSEKRAPTEAEIRDYAVYSIDWQEKTGMQGRDMEIILSLCTYVGEQTIGSNVYDTYESDTLRAYLPNFAEMMQLAVLNDVALYIQYTTPEGNMITLGYSEEGLQEKSVYDIEEDTMFYETGDVTEVWTKFRSGYQWGKG